MHRNDHFSRIGCPGRRRELEHPDGWVRHVLDAAEIGRCEPLDKFCHRQIFRVQTKMPVNSTPLIEIAASEAKMVVRTLRIVSFL